MTMKSRVHELIVKARSLGLPLPLLAALLALAVGLSMLAALGLVNILHVLFPNIFLAAGPRWLFYPSLTLGLVAFGGLVWLGLGWLRQR